MKVYIPSEVLSVTVMRSEGKTPLVSIQFFDPDGKVRDAYGILDQETNSGLANLKRGDHVTFSADIYIKDGRLKTRLKDFKQSKDKPSS